MALHFGESSATPAEHRTARSIDLQMTTTLCAQGCDYEHRRCCMAQDSPAALLPCSPAPLLPAYRLPLPFHRPPQIDSLFICTLQVASRRAELFDQRLLFPRCSALTVDGSNYSKLSGSKPGLRHPQHSFADKLNSSRAFKPLLGMTIHITHTGREPQ